MSMSMSDVRDMEAEMERAFFDGECSYPCEVCGEESSEEEFLVNEGCCFNCKSKLV